MTFCFKTVKNWENFKTITPQKIIDFLFCARYSFKREEKIFCVSQSMLHVKLCLFVRKWEKYVY